jgi:hypothetical protein
VCLCNLSNRDVSWLAFCCQQTNLFVFETAGSSELGAEFNFKYDIRFTEISATSGDAVPAPAAALPVPDGDKPITMYQRRRLFWNHVSEKLKAYGVSTCILDGSMLFTSAKIVNADTGAPTDVLELAITDSCPCCVCAVQVQLLDLMFCAIILQWTHAVLRAPEWHHRQPRILWSCRTKC